MFLAGIAGLRLSQWTRRKNSVIYEKNFQGGRISITKKFCTFCSKKCLLFVWKKKMGHEKVSVTNPWCIISRNVLKFVYYCFENSTLPSLCFDRWRFRWLHIIVASPLDSGGFSNLSFIFLEGILNHNSVPRTAQWIAFLPCLNFDDS